MTKQFFLYDAKVPKSLVNAIKKKYVDRVEEVQTDDDGHWVYLRDNWFSPYSGSHTIHEDTVKEVLDILADTEPADDLKNNPQRPAQFFHVAASKNVRSILKNGLQPKRGSRSAALGEGGKAVFLFSSREGVDDALANWLGDEFDEDEPLSLLLVMVPDSIAVTPTFDGATSWEWVSRQKIPPQYISLAAEEI